MWRAANGAPPHVASRTGVDPDDGSLSDAGVMIVTAADNEPFRRHARLTWEAVVKKVYEIDPLLCPFCGGEMKIIAFITEHAPVAHILEHIQMPARSAPSR